MKLNLKLILAALGLSLCATAQNTDPQAASFHKPGCGTQLPPKEWDEWFNKKVQEYKDSKSANRTENVSITIPVIVHVIHGGQAVGTFPNISAAQVHSQINVLNNDYAGTGYNTYQLASTGFSLVGAANTHITFCPAQYDASGNLLAEPGIDRVNYVTQSWTNPASPTSLAAFENLMDNTIKPNTIWDPTYFYNIWVSDVNSGAAILGYATFPSGANLTGLISVGNSGTDGIWVWAKSFGNVGTLQSPYNLGRTASHETGHWLGLRHIGGDGNGNPSGDCSATDYCDDTPPQSGGYAGGQYGQNFGGPAYPLHANVCSSPYGDMFMNFMDYTDDAYCYMFTPDQNDRMQTALQTGYFRTQMSASSYSLCMGMPLADFIADSVACFNSNVMPYNVTPAGPTPTYSWSVMPSAGVTFSPNSSNASPGIHFPGAGSYTVTMVATNSLGASSATVAMRLEDCTGIKENSLSGRNISLYPNPSTGQLTISNTGEQALQIMVYNAIGQQVLNKQTTGEGGKIALDLSAYPNGIYTISIGNGQEKVVKKLVLSK